MSRHRDGFRGSWLFKRVWGDLKDHYGREWRRFYQQQRPERIEYAVSDATSDEPGEANVCFVNRAVYNENPTALPDRRHVPDTGAALDCREALARLSEPERECVQAICIDGQTVKAYSAAHGCSPFITKKLLQPAKEKLRQWLTAYEPGPR